MSDREWQPIETAPLDGTAVDLWSAKGFRFTDAAWDIVSYSHDGNSDVFGWTCTSGHGSIEDGGPYTHWMPRPSAPTGQGR